MVTANFSCVRCGPYGVEVEVRVSKPELETLVGNQVLAIAPLFDEEVVDARHFIATIKLPVCQLRAFVRRTVTTPSTVAIPQMLKPKSDNDGVRFRPGTNCRSSVRPASMARPAKR